MFLSAPFLLQKLNSFTKYIRPSRPLSVQFSISIHLSFSYILFIVIWHLSSIYHFHSYLCVFHSSRFSLKKVSIPNSVCGYFSLLRGEDFKTKINPSHRFRFRPSSPKWRFPHIFEAHTSFLFSFFFIFYFVIYLNVGWSKNSSPYKTWGFWIKCVQIETLTTNIYWEIMILSILALNFGVRVFKMTLWSWFWQNFFT